MRTKLAYKNDYNVVILLQPENMEEMTWSKQEDFLNATLKNSLLEKYPVNSNFARLFLKKLIQYLEAGNEIHDDLYTYLCLKMKSNNNESFSYRHYIIGNDLINIVTLKETNNIVVNGTTGMRTWEVKYIQLKAFHRNIVLRRPNQINHLKIRFSIANI